ncbi:MAG: DUF4912 domain-containing protein [Chthoniobacterales bacterium]
MKKSSKSAAKTAKPKSKSAKRPAPAKRRPGPKTKPQTRRPPARRRAAKKPAGADIDHLGDLPRSYGDGGIFVVAQEPHWLFSYWDYTLSEGIEGAVFLRHGRQGAERPEAEVPVPADTNSWYFPVRDADADYYVELGHYRDGDWKTLTRSGTVLTPRDTLAGFGEAVFANMPFHATFQQLVEKLRGEIRGGESLAAALARLQARGNLTLGRLTPAQRIALDRLLDTELGSLTSGELSRFLGSPGASPFAGGLAPSSWAQAPGGFSSGLLAATGQAGASWGVASFESALGSRSSAAMAVRRGESSWLSSWSGPHSFFMHLNAEVIFYGGTHPEAKVTVGGEEITVRPDGTFRYHFVLPDGEFEIPVVAVSPDGLETRRGVLRFQRETTRQGGVGATAQLDLGEPMGRKG